MATITIRDIDKRLRQLPSEKLIVVYNFVSDLLEREGLPLFKIAGQK